MQDPLGTGWSTHLHWSGIELGSGDGCMDVRDPDDLRTGNLGVVRCGLLVAMFRELSVV